MLIWTIACLGVPLTALITRVRELLLVNVLAADALVVAGVALVTVTAPRPVTFVPPICTANVKEGVPPFV